jgi:hypothetical protein
VPVNSLRIFEKYDIFIKKVYFRCAIPVCETADSLNDARPIKQPMNDISQKGIAMFPSSSLSKNFIATAVAALGAAAASAQVDVTCTSSITGGTTQNVLVPMGASCTLTDVRVLGNVEVKDAASVIVRRGSINGDVIVELGASARLNRGNVNGSVAGFGARLVSVNGTTIAKDVLAEDTATVVIASGASIGKLEALRSGRITMSGVRVAGDVKFEENFGAIVADGNNVAGNFEAYLNSGGASFSANVIRGNMQCKENLPAPTGTGNVAAIKEDQCATL